MGSESSSGSGPVLRLLARALEHWLRLQCEGIQAVEIRLLGSAASLLGGELEGVELVASQVVFQELRIESVHLRSDSIRVRMGPLLRGRSLRLEHPFTVRGEVAFTGEGLSLSLGSPAWRILADGLAKGLLGTVPLESLRITEDRLLLSGDGGDGPVEVAAELEAVPGGVAVRSLEGDATVTVPMDPAITIERARVADGRLQFEGTALVAP